MRWGCLILALSVSTQAFGHDQSQGPLLLPCSQTSTDNANCNPSKNDRKQARAAFSLGLKLQKAKRSDQALEQFENAAQLDPHNIEYLTAREMARQQLVFAHLQQGNAALLNRRPIEAMAEFRHALFFDPHNEFAQQRLQDAAAEWQPRNALPARVEGSGEVRINPDQNRSDFHYRGDARGLLTQVAGIYGLKVTFDDSVVSRPVNFSLGDADFYTAMRAACAVTKTFWTPLEEKRILLAAETADNHRNFDRMSLRTFYLSGSTTPQELTEVTNLLRNIFEIRFVISDQSSHSLVVRAPQDVLDAATRFLENLDNARPQVLLDVQVFQVSHSLTRNMGLNIPNQFQLFNIPVGALAALGGQNIQDLINQLFSNGGINQSTNQALSGLLAQLQNQQSGIFSQPLATFGSGLTFMGLSLGTAGAQLSLMESWVRTLEHATLRAGQGSDTTFRIGTRFPILNATFAPIFNNQALSRVIQDNSFQPAFPSFNYEDIGLLVKAKPFVGGTADVGLQLELQFRTLQGQSSNGIPVISNREYKGSINLRNGEPAVVAGSVNRTEQRSLSGLPGFGAVPALNKVMTNNSKQENEDELLILITPHVLSDYAKQAAEVWMGK